MIHRNHNPTAARRSDRCNYCLERIWNHSIPSYADTGCWKSSNYRGNSCHFYTCDHSKLDHQSSESYKYSLDHCNLSRKHTNHYSMIHRNHMPTVARSSDRCNCRRERIWIYSIPSYVDTEWWKSSNHRGKFLS